MQTNFLYKENIRQQIHPIHIREGKYEITKKMNRNLIKFFATLSLIMVPAVYSEAASISLGFSTWHSWWIPANVTKMSQPLFIQAVYPVDNAYRMHINPNFRYGPALTMRLPKNISISSEFLYGQFTAKKKDLIYFNFIIKDKIGYIRRYDFNLILCYSFIDLMHVSAGFNYSHITNTIKSFSQTWAQYYAAGKKVIKMNSDEYTPLLGMGISIPAIRDILTINIDAAFLFCFAHVIRNESSLGRHEYSSQISFIPPHDIKESNKNIGMNASCKIKYHVPVAPVGVSVGFRYTMHKRLVEIKNNNLEYEHQYGITAAVDYIFNIK